MNVLGIRFGGYIMPCVRISVMVGEGDCSVVNALTVKYCRLGRSSSRNVNVIWIGLYLSESWIAFVEILWCIFTTHPIVNQFWFEMEGHHMNYRRENPNHFCQSTPYVVFLFSFPKGILNFILLMSVVDCLIKRLNKCATQVLYNWKINSTVHRSFLDLALKKGSQKCMAKKASTSS